MVFAALAAVCAAAGAAELDEIRKDGFTVRFASCPKCAYRMRLAADGRSATVNLSRIKDDAPDTATVQRRCRARAERAFALMRMADDTRRPGKVKRPLLGWSSWNTFGCEISEPLILSVAQAMATNGLKDAGYRYVNIDDGFFYGHDSVGRLRFNPKRFPNGMKGTVDGIHALGLKAGIYSDAGTNSCGSTGGDIGGIGSGLYGHDAADCQLHFRELGFDFIKVDYCGGCAMRLEERQRYTEIARAIRATGRDDVRFNICRWGFPGTWAADIAESWRVTGDIRANWKSLHDIIERSLYLAPYCRPGRYNDMDMLEVGQLVGKLKTVFGKHGDTGLTRDEEVTHFGLWCMMSSPLLIGCDVRTMDEESLELVTNPFLLAMNQNDLGLGGSVVQRTGEAYVLVKDAVERFGKARFVALYNATDAEHEFTVPFATLDLGGKVEAFDLVECADIGELTGSFTMRVPAHGARFLRLDAERRLDRTVYEAENAYLAEFQDIRDKEAAGTPELRNVEGASGGVVVTRLGGRATNDLVWREVRVSADGTYELALTTFPDKEREIFVDIDGKAPRYVLKVKPDQPTARLKVALSAGVHTVRLSNHWERLPDIDVLHLRSAVQ